VVGLLAVRHTGRTNASTSALNVERTADRIGRVDMVLVQMFRRPLVANADR